MTSKIPTTYKDEFGSVDTEIINDHETLTLIVEGIKFASKHFDDFSPVDIDNVPSRFKLNHFKELTDCSLLCRIPMTVTKQNNDIPATLIVNIHLSSSEKEYKTYS